MKMETLHVFAMCYEYTGLHHVVVDEKSREFYDSKPEAKYLCDIEVPAISDELGRELTKALKSKEVEKKRRQIARLESGI